MTFFPASPHGPVADSLFAAWLARHEAGGTDDFEELCRAHPVHLERLRELRLQWSSLRGVIVEAGLADLQAEPVGPRLAAELSRPSPAAEAIQFGSDASSQLMARLASRGPAGHRYRMEGEIARGGMGAILRAWDEDLRRHLAMKVILGQAHSGPRGTPEVIDRQALARFLEEAQVTGQLEHPGIVPVHELGLDGEGRVYFTMKLVEGLHLGEVLELVRLGREGWTRTRALGVMQRVCEAMSYAHSRGVVHRDLKPRNVMVGRFGEVYVMDWGLARILEREPAERRPVETEREIARQLDSASATDTRAGTVLGTLEYMPPEQAMGRIEAISPQSDVYAVGAMLYHLLAGHPPFVEPDCDPTRAALWKRVMAGPPTALVQRSSGVPAELVAICERAMARRAEDRYGDMAGLAKDLAAYLEHRVVSAYETGAWAETKKWVQRNRPLAATLAIAGIAAFGGLGSVAAVQASGRRELDIQADLFRLPYLEQEAERLWPEEPGMIPAMERWLVGAEFLASRLDLHRSRLADLRRKALPVSDADLAYARRQHPLGRELEELTLLVQAKREGLQTGNGLGEDRDMLPSDLEALARRRSLLTSQLDRVEVWRFETSALQLEHDTLARTVTALESFAGSPRGPIASVRARLEWAHSVERRTVGDFAEPWQVAAEAVRSGSSPYGSLVLSPQLGLIPLGADPVTGLQEFAHLRSGKVPERDAASGTLTVDDWTGIVFVLLPAGRFQMGAQRGAPSEPGFSPWAYPNEGPPHEVGLESFLIAKYELSRGQWIRLGGSAPGRRDDSTEEESQAHPIAGINWLDCVGVLNRFGLALPTEAQWEYAARAGATTAFPAGDDPKSLAGSVNLADRSVLEARLGWPQAEGMEWLDDGFARTSPIGHYAANRFGLHDVIGNVWEWCRDEAGSYSLPHRPGDGLIVGGEENQRVARGGAFLNNPPFARLAIRDIRPRDFVSEYHGLRPVRDLSTP